MLNILVVEDSPTMRQLISFAMKRIPNSRVIEASDGVDALKKLSSEKIDLILADINMPVMNGLKLLNLIRENNAYKKTPVIIITTEGAEEDKKRAMALGADAYLSKPIQTQELIRLVNSFISQG
ncbi:MAG: response regulator [Nitrospirae bacterium]|nr:response regulator [Nitrospirota bacterium]